MQQIEILERQIAYARKMVQNGQPGWQDTLNDLLAEYREVWVQNDKGTKDAERNT